MAEGNDYNRDMILANFQAASGLEDVGICFEVLEQHSWNLQSALQAFMSHDDGESRHGPVSQPTVPLLESPESQAAAASSAASAASASSAVSGSPRARHLHFRVRVDEDACGSAADQSTAASASGSASSPYLDVIVQDTDTVMDIKRQLLTLMPTPIDIDHMRLVGFPTSVRNGTELRSLRLPKETELVVTSANPAVRRRQRRQICLSVLNSDTGDRQDFYYDADSTGPGRLKGDVYSVWGLPTQAQEWQGWPGGVEPPETFGACSDLPDQLELAVKTRQRRGGEERTARNTPMDAEDEDEDEEIVVSDDEHEADGAGGIMDCDVEAQAGSGCQLPLIRPGTSSEIDGVEQFTERFVARYGGCPIFFCGSLAKAVEESNGRSASERKPLALYIHHDKSIAAQIFCSNVLTNPGVVDFLNCNFVLWPWDVTHPENASMLTTLVVRQLGLEAANRVRQLDSETLPVLLLVQRVKATHELLAEVQAVNDADSVLACLLKAREDAEAVKAEEVREENAREMRTMERLEMQSAYEESLRLDRQKEEARLREEKEKQDRERREREATERALAELPAEPAAGSPAATIRLRLPGGAGTRQRRFSRRHLLRHLLAYCASLGYPGDKFCLVTSFPRRVLSDMDDSITMEEAGLCPQETVLLEER